MLILVRNQNETKKKFTQTMLGLSNFYSDFRFKGTYFLNIRKTF